MSLSLEQSGRARFLGLDACVRPLVQSMFYRLPIGKQWVLSTRRRQWRPKLTPPIFHRHLQEHIDRENFPSPAFRRKG